MALRLTKRAPSTSSEGPSSLYERIAAEAQALLDRPDVAGYRALWSRALEVEDRDRRYQLRRRLAQSGLEAGQRMSRRSVPALFAAVADALLEVLEEEPREPVMLNLAGVALFEQWRDRATIVALPENRNFAGGSNAGAAAAAGEVVVFLNNDTEVQPGTIEGLVEEAWRPDVGARRLPDGVPERHDPARRHGLGARPGRPPCCRSTSSSVTHPTRRARAPCSISTSSPAPAWRSGASCSPRSAASTRATSTAARTSTCACVRVSAADESSTAATCGWCTPRPAPAAVRTPPART